jgi:YVTN family beta-propeller protein
MAASDQREFRLGAARCVVSASSTVLLVAGLACLLGGCCGGNAGIEVDFEASVTSGPAPLTVSFTPSTPHDVTAWDWVFGDGGTSGEENPTHTYTAAGTYTVSLTVTPTYSVGNPSVATRTKEGYIVVQLPSTYTLTYTAGANGTITGSTPQTVAHGASGTPVTAAPDTGYHFVKWSDDVMTASRTDTNVTADVTVTALFAINSYTLTYIAGANGTITGSTPQTVTHGASGSLVTAVPSSGYHFVKWSDDVMTASRTDTNVTADITVTATFAMAHKAYVANAASDSVSVIDTVTNAVAATIPVGAGPMGIAISGDKAYVANYGSASVSVINTVSNTVSAAIPVGNYPVSIAISGKQAYVTNNGYGPASDRTVSVINTDTGMVTATIPVGDHPWGVACTASGAYVTNNYEDTVSVIRTDTNTVSKTITVGAYPLGVAISGGYVYVANYHSSSLSVISTLTDTVTATIALGATPYCIATRGEEIYVTTETGKSVLVVDTGTNTVSDTIMLGVDATFIAISGDKAYVTSYSGNSVSVIDTGTNAVIDTVTVGPYPCGIAITP